VIEVVAEVVGGEFDPGTHPLSLGVRHLPDPAILQYPEHGQSSGKNHERDQRCGGAAAPFHGVESSIRICAQIEAASGFYVSYKQLACR
jgi:hypothetical protein